MVTVGATELKNRLGEFIDKARREPVLVKSHGRDAVVLVDHAEFERLRSIEDAYWVSRADEAMRSGLLSSQETMEYLRGRLDDNDEVAES